MTGLEGSPENQFDAEVRKLVTAAPIDAVGSMGTAGRTAARTDLVTRAGFRSAGRVVAAARGIAADPVVANAGGTLPESTATTGLEAADGWVFGGVCEPDSAMPGRLRRMAAAGTGRGALAVPDEATGVDRELPRRDAGLTGLPVWCLGAESDEGAAETAPASDADGDPSSPGVAPATPAAGPPASARPRANAAAPALATRLFADITTPATAIY